jgi:hypothetical protein
MTDTTIIIILIFIIIFIFIAVWYFTDSPKKDTKKIWVFWDSETPPKNVLQIYEYHKKILKTWDIELLNNKTIYKYIKKEDFPKNYENLIIQAKSDWIRLYLLKKYGGVWMDSTIILNSEEALNQLYDKTIQEKSEFSGFTYKSDVKDNIYTYIENWFIMCPKNSNLISKWYDEYTHAIVIGFMEYKQELKMGQVYIDPRIYNLDDTQVYFTMHACLQKILRKDYVQQPKMILMKAEESAFKLMDACGWDAECMKKQMEHDPSTKSVLLIKLIKHVRAHIDDLSFFL